MKMPPLIPWPLIIVTIIVIGIAISVSGCASLEWKQTRPASAKPWFYIHVDDDKVDAVCRSIGTQAARGERIEACATWKPQGCEIVLPRNPSADLIAHEHRHCMGESHQ